MLACPRCRAPLQKQRADAGLTFSCPHGHGHAATLPVLRRRLHPHTTRDLWQAARTSPTRRLPRCPACHHLTTPVTPRPDLHLDACTTCQLVWFDAGEAEALTPAPPPAPAPRKPATRTRVLATPTPPPPLPSVPVAAPQRPVFALTLLALCILGSLGLLSSEPPAPPDPTAPLAPSEPPRRGPIGFAPDRADDLVSWFRAAVESQLPRRRHALLSAAVLGVLGVVAAAETVLRRLRVVTLFVAGHLVACTIHLLARPGSDDRLLGPYGGICAVATYVGAALPHARFRLLGLAEDARLSGRGILIGWALVFAGHAFLAYNVAFVALDGLWAYRGAGAFACGGLVGLAAHGLDLVAARRTAARTADAADRPAG